MNKLFLIIALAFSIGSTSCIHSHPVTAQVLPPVDNREELPKPKILEPEPSPVQKPLERIQLPEVNIPNLTVRKFLFKDNKVYSSKTLEALLTKYLNRTLSDLDLQGIRDTITKYYVDNGYINSGAALLIQDNPILRLEGADLVVRVIEGKLDKVKVEGPKGLTDYVKSRLMQKGAFNNNHLLNSLYLLQDDPLISDLKVTLEPDPTLINVVTLSAKVKAAKTIQTELFLDNYHNPGVGSFERGINFSLLNPFYLGDRFDLIYKNTDGSNSVAANYSLPITTQNTTIKFSYLYSDNNIIEKPFNQIGIYGTSQIFSAGIRQPIDRKATEKYRSEFALGLSVDHSENQDTLLGFNFPVSIGANNSGVINISALRFTQDWIYKDVNQFAFLRSQFSFGLDLGSVTAPAYKNGNFFAWRGDAVWNHKLPLGLIFASKYSLQLSDTPLVGFEQLSAGGETVRGYRQDGLLGDSGILSSFEIRIPIYEDKSSSLSISPFFDLANVWSNISSSGTDSSSTILASSGLSLQYDLTNHLSANFTYAIPLINPAGPRLNLQEQGFLFKLRWSLF